MRFRIKFGMTVVSTEWRVVYMEWWVEHLRVGLIFCIMVSMNAIITVVGSDKVGIISKVSSFLAEHKINIEDITQTILSGNFVMMMMVTLDNSDITIDVLRQEMSKKAEEMGVEINIMNEKVFSSMHRV